jgi:hypothetical protein
VVFASSNMPLRLLVVPAAAASATSSLVLAAPLGAASGARATASLTLADAFGNPRPDADSAQLLVRGAATGLTTLGRANFSAAGAPGAFSYLHTFAAIQNVSFQLVVGGAPTAAPLALPAAGVLPEAVNLTASIAAAAVRPDGADAAAPWLPFTAAGPLAAEAWHQVHVPVLRARPGAWAGRFVADPGLSVSLQLTPVVPNGTLLAVAARVYPGNWSWSGGDYVVPLKLPAPDTSRLEHQFAATLTLGHPSGATVGFRPRRGRAPVKSAAGLQLVEHKLCAS